jgi:hypothetical protein
MSDPNEVHIGNDIRLRRATLYERCVVCAPPGVMAWRSHQMPKVKRYESENTSKEIGVSFVA